MWEKPKPKTLLMQENHGLYVNRTEPIHLMTEVTSVLGSTINILRF